jgi:hypothetical protein
VTAAGRKIRFELTPLEAEAVVAILEEYLVGPKSKSWNRFERRRGSGVAKGAISRGYDKIARGERNG